MANKEFQERALRTIYARILLYSFLTNSKVNTLYDIIESIKKSESNRRIIRNLELKLDLLEAMNSKANVFVLNVLNRKIQIHNSLLADESLSKEDKKSIINKKFEQTDANLMLRSNEGLKFEESVIMNRVI